jgi:hypothetical protein
MQVEFGIKELEACWDGFVDVSDTYGLDFDDLDEVCADFFEALSDYISFACEPAPQP